MPEVMSLRPADARDATAAQPVTPATKTTRRARAARGEPLAFAAAMAAASAWVLDDAFWHREPGTAAADHLVSGLVRVAIAVSAAIAYPRLRAGARAMLALVAGTLMVVAGVTDGARHVAGDRLAGDDPTALLAAVAGFFVVLPVALAIVVNEKARSPVHAAVAPTTSDGLRLSGSYVPSRNGAAVVAFPGRKGPVEYARMLVRHGHGVLLLDRRGEGASDGDYNARGGGGEPDLRAAVASLRAHPDGDGDRIGGLGLPVGGELMLQAAANGAGLRAVVSEGAGLRSATEQKQHMPGAPPVPLRWIAPITVETAAGAVLSDRRPPTDLMPRIAPHAVPLIRGVAGNADEALNRVYGDRGGATTTRWEIPRAGDADGIHAVPAEYERRVVAFFDRALAGAATATSGR